MFSDSGNPFFIVNESEEVCIGTDFSPGYKLKVEGTFNATGNATFAGGVFIRQGSDTGSYFDATNTNTLNCGYHDNSVQGFWINYKGYHNEIYYYHNHINSILC